MALVAVIRDNKNIKKTKLLPNNTLETFAPKKLHSNLQNINKTIAEL